MNEVVEIQSDILSHISPEQAWHYKIIPISLNDKDLSFFIAEDAINENIKAELEIQFNKRIYLEVKPADYILSALNSYYKRTYETAGIRKYDVSQSDDFLDILISEAKQLGSSDIHIEKYKDRSRVRLRVDGVLIERYQISNSDYPSLINKIKIKSHLDISEKRLPQDGRISFTRYNNSFDIRVSILPTLHGEKVVLRLLNNDMSNVDLLKLGMSAKELSVYTSGFTKPNGIILISGPTGSGKTTTLYATLKELNKSTRNILTIEDPIEYVLEGINQVQLKENIGLTFAGALKSFLRQDPDVIMLGEIRDKETAEMAIRSALTGHLVLSTIHTNSAWGTVSRLIDMGIPPFLLASTINISAAQRLVRLLCRNCCVEAAFNDQLYPRQYKAPVGVEKHRIPVGCDECFNTGYKGRKAVYEIIPIDGHLGNEIRKGSNSERPDFAKDIRSISDNAFDLFAKGETSLDEVYSILN